jgi:hypothetical protein
VGIVCVLYSRKYGTFLAGCVINKEKIIESYFSQYCVLPVSMSDIRYGAE